MAMARFEKKWDRFSQRTSSHSCSFSFTLRSAVIARAVGVKECIADSVANNLLAIIRSSPIRFLKSSIEIGSPKSFDELIVPSVTRPILQYLRSDDQNFVGHFSRGLMLR